MALRPAAADAEPGSEAAADRQQPQPQPQPAQQPPSATPPPEDPALDSASPAREAWQGQRDPQPAALDSALGRGQRRKEPSIRATLAAQSDAALQSLRAPAQIEVG